MCLLSVRLRGADAGWAGADRVDTTEGISTAGGRDIVVVLERL